MSENTVSYGNLEAAVTAVYALENLTTAVHDHALITALSSLDSYPVNRVAVRLALATHAGDDELAARLRNEVRGLFR